MPISIMILMMPFGGKIITEKEIPEKYTKILGNTTKKRLDTLVHDIVHSSFQKPDIFMSEENGTCHDGTSKLYV